MLTTIDPHHDTDTHLSTWENRHNRHVYVVGNGGYGKSTLMSHLIAAFQRTTDGRVLALDGYAVEHGYPSAVAEVELDGSRTPVGMPRYFRKPRSETWGLLDPAWFIGALDEIWGATGPRLIAIDDPQIWCGHAPFVQDRNLDAQIHVLLSAYPQLLDVPELRFAPGTTFLAGVDGTRGMLKDTFGADPAPGNYVEYPNLRCGTFADIPRSA